MFSKGQRQQDISNRLQTDRTISSAFSLSRLLRQAREEWPLIHYFCVHQHGPIE